MLIEYKNSDIILNNNLPVLGQRLDFKVLNLLKPKYYLPNFNHPNTKLEFHLYSNEGGYLSGNHSIKNWKQTLTNGIEDLSLNIHSNISEYGFTRGNYKFVYNFHIDLVGTFDSPSKLFISEISPSRLEIKLKLSDLNDAQLISQFNNFIDNVNVETEYWKTYILNFGFNRVINILNISSDRSKKEIYIKLYEQLPPDINNMTFCFLSEELMESYIDKITLIPNEVIKTGNKIRSANFSIETDYIVNSETEFKNWDYLIASGSSTQQLIENIFSGDVVQGIRINTDYTELKNFIHFSSAEERIDNFIYKVKKIEDYDNKISDLSLLTVDSVGETSKVIDNRNKFIRSFDDFEKYLYFGYSGSLYTFPGTASIEPYPKEAQIGTIFAPLTWSEMYEQWINTTGSYVSYYGYKSGSIEIYYPYKLHNTTSSAANDWYINAKEISRKYDKNNPDALRWFLPGHIVDDELNSEAVLFMDMLGHHYDILWTYIKAIKKLYSQEEHIKDGTSPDLLYDLAKQFGWTLTNGKQTKELWENFFGVNQNNLMIQSGSSGIQSVGSDEATKQVWKRIVNNLPNILKSKGSNRSVKAIISSYGIPNSILYSKEYGGPSTTKLRSDLKLNKFQYALNIGNNESLTIPFNKLNNSYLNAIQLRLHSNDYLKYNYSNSPEQLIFSKNDINGNNLFYLSAKYDFNTYDEDKATLILNYNSSSIYFSSSITSQHLFDLEPYNITLQRYTSSLSNNINNEYKLYLSKEMYGKVTIFQSASIVINSSSQHYFNELWNTSGSINIGYDSNIPINCFTGSIREVRLWNTHLDEDVIRQHTTAGRSYVGNSTTSSYYDLNLRFIFGNNKYNFLQTSSLESQQPNRNKMYYDDNTLMKVDYNNFGVSKSLADYYYGYNEDLTYKTPTIGGQNFLSTKIRIEDQTLMSNLNVNNRSTYAAYDDQPLDSSKLVIAFSPQDTINEDIISHIGDANLDDYIGNPSDIYKNYYPELRDFSVEYWKKYSNRNDFNAFFKLVRLYDFGVFEQLRQVLPYRANKILGTLIEPNLLERNRVKTDTIPNISTTHYDSNNELDIKITKISTDSYKNIPATNINQNSIYNLSSDYKTKLETNINRTIHNIDSNNNNYNSNFSIDIYNLKGEYSNNHMNLIGYDGSSSNYNNRNIVKYSSSWVYQTNHISFYDAIGYVVDNYSLSNINLKRNFYYSSLESSSLGIYYSSSYEGSTIQDIRKLPTGIQRNRYKGCVLYTSSIDGTDVVEIVDVDPNTILYTGDISTQNGPLEII